MFTKEELIYKFNEIHNNKYDYSLVDYIGSKIKIKIICKKHGIFEQFPINHIRANIPCKKCRSEIYTKKQKLKFIIDSNKIHNNFYNYDNINYLDNKTKIEIICPLHGSFFQRPDMHIIQKQGCPNCYNDTILTKDIFIIKSNKIHNNKYDYSFIKKISKMVKIKCIKHGIFTQNIYNHLKGHGCPNCNNSKGENKIEEFLIENNIKYIKQKKFDGCINKRKLPFDFYLYDFNTCIEYDGNYHFIDEYVINNDNIKTDYCLNNNIKLLRFNQSNINNLKEIINDNYY